MSEPIRKFLNDPRVVSRVFYPRRFHIPQESENLRVLRIEVEEGVELGGILYLHDSPTKVPTMIYFHGNGEVALDYEGICSMFHQVGVNLAVFDFRAYGFSSGKLSYTALLEDPIPLYHKFQEWMKSEYPGKSATEFILMGRSLGSACASALGAYKNAPCITKLVFESGYSNTYDLMTRLFMIQHPNITPETIAPFSNHTFQKLIQKPTLIIHGERDSIIPIEQGQQIYDCIPSNVPKRFVRIKYATHNDILMYQNEYFEPLQDFIRKT